MNDEPDEAELDEEWEDEEPPDRPPVRYYANVINLLTGTRDIAVDFGYVIGQEPPDWLARISMSWEEARILERYLSAAAQQYEQNIGRIRDVDGLDSGQGNGGTSRRPDEDEDDGDEDADD